MRIEEQVNKELRYRIEKFKHYRDDLKIQPAALQDLERWDLEWLSKVCKEEGINHNPYMINYLNDILPTP